ncbi:acyltransferase [Actinoplanes sp. L3-i22]|uniref:acyltransferase family protein n=1 Tax=Actinoplanes sp. L3-i22 TaxID=2836373 RepID=UPI001C84F7A8|nr:acyltransferase [Actinoplanes sp. L3-i22]
MPTESPHADTQLLIRVPDAAPLAPAPAPAVRPASRLRWLDALRALAVLAVVFEHATDYLAPGLKQATRPFAHAGFFGVALFFMVSGYIVPASIERRGNIRHFWIGRMFRLYPAYLFVIGAVLLLSVWKPKATPRAFHEHPGTTLLSHLTMLQDMHNGVGIQVQFWTLTYEMMFYMLVTAVFLFGVHRFSAEIAVLLSAAAVALGNVLPARMLNSNPLELRNLVIVTAVVMLAGIVAVSSRRMAVVIGGAVLLVALVLGLLGTNQENGPWEGFIILALMFTGTALYRAEQGQISVGRAVTAVAAVLAASVFAAFQYGHIWDMVAITGAAARNSWLGAVVLALAVFGLGMAGRNLPIPGWVGWIGTVSYSIYLTHMFLLRTFGTWLVESRSEGIPARIGVLLVYLAGTLLVSWLCYRLIELPFQSLGRRVAKRFA